MKIRQSVGVHSPSGVELAGLLSLMVAVPAVAVLANSGRKHTENPRRAHQLLAFGGAIATAAALAGVINDLLTADHHRVALGGAVAVTMAVGTLSLIAGTLRLPGAADGFGGALRHVLDALVIAAAVWF